MKTRAVFFQLSIFVFFSLWQPHFFVGEALAVGDSVGIISVGGSLGEQNSGDGNGQGTSQSTLPPCEYLIEVYIRNTLGYPINLYLNDPTLTTVTAGDLNPETTAEGQTSIDNLIDQYAQDGGYACIDASGNTFSVDGACYGGTVVVTPAPSAK